MDTVFGKNGLVFWNSVDLDLRDYLIRIVPQYVVLITFIRP